MKRSFLLKICKLMILSIVSTLVFSSFSCSSEDQISKLDIVGGKTAKRNYPFMVALLDNRGFFCGGSVIGPRAILTAAHCTGATGAFLGSKNRKDTKAGLTLTRAHIKRNVRHPRYNGRTNSNDLRVIVLKKPLPKKYTPIALSRSKSTRLAGKKATAIGWGVTSDNGNKAPTILREVKLNIISRNSCQAKYSKSEVDNSMVCTWTKGKDTCYGDSGGPLFIGGKLVGVTSWGARCADKKYPGVYADVEANTSWIRSFLR